MSWWYRFLRDKIFGVEGRVAELEASKLEIEAKLNDALTRLASIESQLPTDLRGVVWGVSNPVEET